MGVEGIIVAVSALLGAGGLTAFFRARAEAPKLAAEAQSTIIRNLVDENERLRREIRELREDGDTSS